MAGVVVLSSLVNEIFSKLSTAIVAEFGLLWGVKNDLRKLQSNLSTIRDVLEDAEEKQVKDKAVRKWLGKLKDAAYDAEDLVDEFMTEALRRKVDIRDGMRKKVRNFFSTSNPLLFRIKMAHKMKDLRERFDEIAKERDDFHFKVGVVDSHSQPLISRTRETYSRVIASEVRGRQDDKAKIIEPLLNLGNEQDVSVIAIVGMGGLGKTTLAQLVFNDKSVVDHFGLRMWVYVSEVFYVKRLVKDILQSANKGTPGQVSSDQSNLEQLQQDLQKALSGKKYLLVLDDVWNEEPLPWDQLKTLLRCGAVGSKILVTTRSDRVATNMHALQKYPLEKLSEPDSWSLFEHFAFKSGLERRRQPTLESIGKEIVSKCGGLPLAIKTLGSLLRPETREEKWVSVRDSEIWELEEKEGEILPALKLSYNHLASPLKQCFAYCAVFRKGHEIVKDELIKKWIALGFIQGDELLEEKGDGYFDHLLWRSFFQDAEKDDDNVISYTMHDLVHDLAKSVAGTECNFVEGRSQAIPETTRHLSLFSAESKNIQAMDKCKKLRSILSFRRAVEINVYLRFRYLRVLDISDSYIEFLPISLGKLKHLRYLNISRNRITKLPESICNLINLQTLNLEYTQIKRFPNDMRRMASLRHIEFDGAIPLANGIGELTCLRTLPTFVVSEVSGVVNIEELKALNLLRGELSIEGLDQIGNVECAREANMNEKKHLSSLTLSWPQQLIYVVDVSRKSEKVIEYLEPHSNLKRLRVENYMGLNFPRWTTLTNLVSISLSNCKNCEHLPPLGKLPSLESLYMNGMDAVKYIVDKGIIFSSLKKLELDSMPNLEGWSSLPVDDDGLESECLMFPRLQVLKARNCPRLAHFPRDLPALEDLDMDKVGCVRIDLSTARQTLKRAYLESMPDLKAWLSQQADDEREEQDIFTCLHILNVKNCPEMISLPRLLRFLEKLYINQTNEMLLLSVGHYTSLRVLEIVDIPKLMSLSNQLKNLLVLENLNIEGCDNLVLFADGWQCLNSLKELIVRQSCKTQTSFSGDGIVLTNLEVLKIEGCDNLVSLFEDLQNLPVALQHLSINGCPKLKCLPEWVGNLTSLKSLTIEGCGDLVLSSDRLQCLSSLQNLIIRNTCKAQTSFSGDEIFLSNLINLEIRGCENLKSFFEGMQNFPAALQSLKIESCPKLKCLPEWVGNLTSLKELEIKNLPGMKALPESMGNLTSLSSLSIQDCLGMNALPESMGNLKSLYRLTIKNCLGMNALPESMGNLTSLFHLLIQDCPNVKALPESTGNLTSLSLLWIQDCPNVKALPESMGNLKSLSSLWIQDCPDLERRVKGADWHKVTNVPNIYLDGQQLSNEERRLKKGAGTCARVHCWSS